MRQISIIKGVLAVIPLLALLGCTQPYIVNTAIEYNKSLAQYVNEEILLNAVRASKRSPMSFSAIGGYTGVARKTGTLSAFLPLTGVLTGGSISPTLEGYIQDGTSFQNLNADEFTKKMKEPVAPDLMLNYLSQNWPGHLIFSIFVNRVTINAHVYARWMIASRIICSEAAERGGFRANWRVCRALNEDMARLEANPACAEEFQEVTLRRALTGPSLISSPERSLASIKARIGRNQEIRFLNDGRLECEYVKFRTVFHVLRMLDAKHRDIEPDKTYEFEQQSQTVVSQRGPSKSRTVTKQLNAEKNQADVSFVPTIGLRGGRLVRVDSDRIPERYLAEFKLRSPQEMIAYLGALVAAQNYNPLGQGFEPMVNVQKQYFPVELFNVKRGVSANAAVSITDDEGQRYHIPKPDYGSENEDRSMLVVSLIAQIIALQTVGGELPQPPQTIAISAD